MQRATRFRMLHLSPANSPIFLLCSFLDGLVSTPLKSVSIGENKLGDEGVSVLCESLKTNTTLEKLDIEGDGDEDVLGATGAKLIAEMLKVNTPLTTLNLRNNEIGPEGAIAIAEALPR